MNYEKIVSTKVFGRTLDVGQLWGAALCAIPNLPADLR